MEGKISPASDAASRLEAPLFSLIFMYGKPTHGADGQAYDSKSEERVARMLDQLRLERIVAGYVPHVVLAGLEWDFLVVLGEGARGQGGAVVALDYDGLGAARRSDLAYRIDRMMVLGFCGIETRFLLKDDEESVRETLMAYKKPHFARKMILCPRCGSSRSITVIDGYAGSPGRKKELQENVPCAACS